MTPPELESQSILAPITEAAIFLTLCVDPGGEDVVADLLPDLGGLRRSVGFRASSAGLSCVVGIGAGVWDRLFGAPRPAGLHPFRELQGARHSAPATPGDLFVHIRAERLDLCFEPARLIGDRLTPAVRVVDEVHGFRSFDERALLGFVDGTENPEGRDADDAVLIGDEDPAFAGGSYLVIQKYVHDLAGWSSLPVDSHLTLNVIEDGDQQQVMRFNMPFGRIGSDEFGTFYVAYARTPAVIEQMLENMFLGLGDATHDRILDFSAALTGNLYFVPSADFLDDPTIAKAAVADPEAAPTHASDPPAVDGSLGIGDLRP
jgi:porphyrinogen peroxidase